MVRDFIFSTFSLAYLTADSLHRLQEETAKVEENLLNDAQYNPSFTDAIVKCLTISKANAFENLLEPLQKLLRLSPAIASTLARPDLFTRIGLKLHHNKAAVRLNLLRIVSSICDSSEEQGGLLAQYDLLDAIRELEDDPAILVRDMAGKLVRSSERIEASGLGKRKSAVRQRSISTMSSPTSPTTPQMNRSSQSKGYFEGRETPRHARTGLSGSSLALRPGSRDGGNNANASLLPANGGSGTPRNRFFRGLSRRQSQHEGLQDESTRPEPIARRRSMMPRRRRLTLADTGPS